MVCHDWRSVHQMMQESMMATSDNPFVPIPKTEVDKPEDHQHEVPIVNIDGDRETLEDDYGEPPLKPEDEVPEEDPDDEPLADQQ
jgi:hypothetical protein